MAKYPKPFDPARYIHPYLDDDEDAAPSDPAVDPEPDPHLLNMSYGEYLSTQHWQEKRRRALLRAGGICKRCHRESNWLEVHHLTYERRGREREIDLLVVCPDCHGKLHGKGAG